MGQPVVAQTAPFAVTLNAGEYPWRACGRSKTQPMCDGSHQATGVTPVTFTLAEPKKVYLCAAGDRRASQEAVIGRVRMAEAFRGGQPCI